MLWNISLKLKHVGKIKQLFGDKKIMQPHSVHPPPPFCWGGGGDELPTKFLKRGAW